jgi:predicted regulator of Ras-like GTPase activity (Roadblock/LC7/MglB family)
MFNPAGVSGEANSGEKKYCVQTEFAPRPKPRITTSVSLNGEVVLKVENVWEKLPQSEEDKDEIEKFLKKQHQEVIKDITEKRDDSVLTKNEAKKNSICQEERGDEAILKIKEAISEIQGVIGWTLFTSDGQVIGHDVLNSEDQNMAGLAQHSIDLASLLSSVSKVGSLVGGVLESEEMRLVFIPTGENLFAVRVNPEVNIKELVQKIRSMV